MGTVNIYCASGIKTIGKSKGYVIYLLESEINGQPYTKHWIEEVEESYNSAGVETVRRALSKILDPDCNIVIYTDSHFFEGNIKRAGEWASEGWTDKKGNERKFKDKWTQILNILSTHKYKVSLGNHIYSHWLLSELKRAQMKQQTA